MPGCCNDILPINVTTFIQVLYSFLLCLFILQQLYQIQPVTMPAGQELTQTMFIQSTNQTADAQVTQVSTDWAPTGTIFTLNSLRDAYSRQHLPRQILDNPDFKQCFLKWGTQTFLTVLENPHLHWVKKGTVIQFHSVIQSWFHLPPPYCLHSCHSPSH